MRRYTEAEVVADARDSCRRRPARVSRGAAAAVRAIRRCRTARSRSRWTARRSCRSASSRRCATDLAAGRPVELAALAVAGWMRYVRGDDEHGQPIARLGSAGIALRRDRRRVGQGSGRVCARAACAVARSSETTCQTMRDSPGPSSAGSAGCFPTGPRRRWPAPCACDRAPLRNRSPRRAHGRRIPSDHEPPKMIPLDLHPDRLFPADPATRGLARSLYATVQDLPIVSPHGHTDPQWFADDAPFAESLPRCSSSRTTTCSGCSTARACRSRTWASRAQRRAGAGSAALRCAHDLADLRGALPPVPRHADAAVARPRVPRRSSASTSA